MNRMAELKNNISYTVRQWRKSPGFILVAWLTLTVGIGAVTAIFSVMDAVLLRPLPFPHPEQLIALHERVSTEPDLLGLPAPDVMRFQRESRAFTGVAGFISDDYELTGAGEPFRVQAERVSALLLPVLEVQPLLGRNFTQQEDDGSAPVALISYALWRERFGGDPQILGRKIALDRRPYTIIGVMPRSFEFPLNPGRLSARDLWTPLSLTPAERRDEGDNFDYSVIARLRPGVTLAQAQSDVNAVIRGIQALYPPKFGVRVYGVMESVKEQTVARARPLLRALMGAAALVLLIAVVNLANLLLVRAVRRRREFGVRLAIGADRRALVRQLLTESLLLSLVGGVGGVALAAALVRLGRDFLPESLPRIGEIALHWPVLLLSCALMVATGVVCGLAPSAVSWRLDILHAISDAAQTGASRAHLRARAALVILEACLAMLLLVSAGLMLRSYTRMLETSPGFDPARVITAEVALPPEAYPTQQRVDAFFDRLAQRLRALPDVRAVGFSSNLPVVGMNSGRMFTPEQYAAAPGKEWRIASNYLVAGDYFRAMRIPLVAGRYFTAADDRPDAPLAVIISRTVARRYFNGRNPLGQFLHWGDVDSTGMPLIAVVGVVEDIKQSAFDQPTAPEMYEPLSQLQRSLGPLLALHAGPHGDMRIAVRTGGDPAMLEDALRRAVHSLDPQLAVTHVRAMREVVSATEAPRRFNTALLGAFAAVALLLALLGIYGVLAYSVSERTREIAVRMALGAPRAAVIAAVVRSGLALSALGVTGGAVLSFALLRFLKSLLYGVAPLDSVSFAVAAVVLLAAALAASLLPARYAARIEPMQALREQ